MVDYFPVLERAVAALDPNTKEARRVVYDRARRALVDGLRASDPTLSDTDLKTQSMALEAAIRRVEAEAAGGEAPPGPPVPPAVQPPRREAPRVAVSHPQGRPQQPPPVRAAAPPPVEPPETSPEPYEEPAAPDYPDRPPLDDDGPKPWKLIAASLAVLGVILMGAGAYTFWPSSSTPPAQRGAAANAPDAAGAAPYVYLRQPVYYRTTHPVGTIVVDKQQNFLYVVRPSVSALRYGIGVGPECKTAAGLYQIVRKEEWPGLKAAAGKSPTDDERNKNPFGARALYLAKEGRVHGTNTPSSIGRPGPIGCFRLTNDDVIHLYERAPVDTRVVVVN
jgi:lipoprotein-anchoring transpeptidase ErfK/SrfK